MAEENTGRTRRQFLHASVAAGGLVMVGSPDVTLAAEETYKWKLGEITPGIDAGPFYPLLNKPAPAGTDLTVVNGSKDRAHGQLVYLMGQILNIRGNPIKGVKVEIWQANAAGRYSHPSDGNPAPVDPNFQGYGVAVTDAEGRYQFKTVKPGAYPVTQGFDRPPHVHFELAGRWDRQITQMWFPDDPLNGQDRLFNVLRPAAQAMLVCKLDASSGNREPDAKIATFNIIMPNG